MTSGSSGRATNASAHASETTPLPEYTQGIGHTSRSTKMPEQLTLDPFLGSTSSPPASPASLSQLLELKEECPARMVRSLLRRCGWPEPEKCRTYCLRTSSDYFTTTEAGPSGKCYPRWMSAGMMRNGSALTGTVSFPNPATECSLSDVLEENVPDKYFLSLASVKKMRAYAARHAGKGFRINVMRGLSLLPIGKRGLL